LYIEKTRLTKPREESRQKRDRCISRVRY